ncbi:MAG: type II secretion system F family protein [Patescibacteria group bacterium]|nr:type II secretion system F family protein [Patescibacteria group bacterium]
MDKYVYEARDKAGKVIKGMVEADSSEAAEDVLKYNQLFVISVRPYRTVEEKILFSIHSIIGGVKAKDKAVFARQLSTMITAGLPLMDALKYIVKQTRNKDMALTTLKLISFIERGKSFSFALEQLPEVFPQSFISMVRSGEASGKLDQVLANLADQLESNYAMRSKIKGALVYPVFILFTLFGVGVFALVFIIPKLAEVFSSSGVSLPITTLLLIGASNFVINYWYILIVVIIVVVVFIGYYITTENGKVIVSILSLRLPVMSKINKGIYVATFARTLGLLTSGGVPIIKALSIVSDSIGNTIIERQLKDAMMDVEKGIPLSEPIAKIKAFPPLVSSMIAVGEQTGQLDKIMLNIARIYEEDTNNSLKGLTSLIEPIIMLIVGIGVAVLAVSVIMPIYQLTTVF